MEALEEIAAAYPEAYFINTRRASVEEHVRSIEAFGHMLSRFKDVGLLKKFAGQSSQLSDYRNAEIMVTAMTDEVVSFFAR